MILGQSAGTVASLAIRSKKNLHHLTYDEIKKQLIADGQILEF
jgi:hypothetical protein